MNKQYDIFIKMKLKEISETISRMTYAYIQPETDKPTIVPSSHYRNILDKPVEAMVNSQVKKQFLNIMYKQMKSLKDEEPQLFYETLLLMNINKTPDNLEVNEEIALKLTANEIVDIEKNSRKKDFNLLNSDYLYKYEQYKSDNDLIARILKADEDDEEDDEYTEEIKFSWEIRN